MSTIKKIDLNIDSCDLKNQIALFNEGSIKNTDFIKNVNVPEEIELNSKTSSFDKEEIYTKIENGIEIKYHYYEDGSYTKEYSKDGLYIIETIDKKKYTYKIKYVNSDGTYKEDLFGLRNEKKFATYYSDGRKIYYDEVGNVRTVFMPPGSNVKKIEFENGKITEIECEDYKDSIQISYYDNGQIKEVKIGESIAKELKIPIYPNNYPGQETYLEGIKFDEDGNVINVDDNHGAGLMEDDPNAGEYYNIDLSILNNYLDSLEQYKY